MLSLLAAVGAMVLAAPAAAFASGSVYVQTNAASGNWVQIFHAGADGRLAPVRQVYTGGHGLGAGLGSEGSVTLSQDGHWLFAVNAGSNTVTLFQVTADGLRRTDVVATHGTTPVSVTQWGNLVYVVNSGSGTIAGFRLSGAQLSFVTGSVRRLSDPAAAPAQIEFRPGGKVLVVTEKATSRIAIFHVQANGAAAQGRFPLSRGQTPFGFAFAGSDTLVVSEAFGGAAGASATSSYRVDADGSSRVISGSVPDRETAACWVATTADGRYAYVANTGSGTVSSYTVSTGGSLHLLRRVAAGTGSGSAPADEALGQSDRFLYVLDGGQHQVDAFRMTAGGGLAANGSFGHLPASAAGLAAS